MHQPYDGDDDDGVVVVVVVGDDEDDDDGDDNSDIKQFICPCQYIRVFATAMCSLHLVGVACDDVREDSDVGDETVRDTDSQ